MEKLLERTAYLGSDETNKDISNRRKVIIDITNGVPLVAIHDDIILNTTIKEVTTTTAIDNTVTNVLVDGRVDELDNDGNNVFNADRYLLITKIESAINKDVICLYYDALFEDMFLIPETNYLGTEDANDINSNQVFRIKGYRVSGGDQFKDDIYMGSVKPDAGVSIKLPIPNKVADSKHILSILYGISPTMGHRTVYHEISATTRVSDKRLLPAGIIDIGDVLSLFGDNIAVPTYTLYQGDSNLYKVKYLGFKKPDKVYILLDF